MAVSLLSRHSEVVLADDVVAVEHAARHVGSIGPDRNTRIRRKHNAMVLGFQFGGPGTNGGSAKVRHDPAAPFLDTSGTGR